MLCVMMVCDDVSNDVFVGVGLGTWDDLRNMMCNDGGNGVVGEG